MSQFQSTSFYLNQWANSNDETNENSNRDIVVLDLLENESTREVCKGDGCTLYHDNDQDKYTLLGGCVRNTICTETRILRDQVFIKTGVKSNTAECVDHPEQLRLWD